MEQPRLVLSDGGRTLATFDLPVGSAVVGRSDEADIVVDSEFVSRRHARFTWDGSVLRISDLSSNNGTIVNGARIVETIDLRDRDRIQLGTVDGYVVVPTGSDSTRILPPIGTEVPDAGQHQASAPRPGRRSVFISYASQDLRTAQLFVTHLRGRGWQVILDLDILQPGEPWNQRIAESIANCSAVLVLMSPAAAGSQWVNQELVAAVNARRPVLPVVIDDYQIGETRRRFAVVGDRQWLSFGNLTGHLDPVEMDTIAHHLDRLARGVRPDQTVTGRERLGSIVMWIGILVVVATLGWYAVGLVRVARVFVDVMQAGLDTDLRAGDPFAEVDEEFARYVGGLAGLFVALPIAFVGMVATAWGFIVRRNARKRRLMARP